MTGHLLRHQWPLSKWFYYSNSDFDYVLSSPMLVSHQSCCLSLILESVAKTWSYAPKAHDQTSLRHPWWYLMVFDTRSRTRLLFGETVVSALRIKWKHPKSTSFFSRKTIFYSYLLNHPARFQDQISPPSHRWSWQWSSILCFILTHNSFWHRSFTFAPPSQSLIFDLDLHCHVAHLSWPHRSWSRLSLRLRNRTYFKSILHSFLQLSLQLIANCEILLWCQLQPAARTVLPFESTA
jgi:hypothetical protein